jgi:hypothetical protein
MHVPLDDEASLHVPQGFPEFVRAHHFAPMIRVVVGRAKPAVDRARGHLIDGADVGVPACRTPFRSGLGEFAGEGPTFPPLHLRRTTPAIHLSNCYAVADPDRLTGTPNARNAERENKATVKQAV